MNQMKVVAVGDLQEAKDGRNFFTITLQGGFGQKTISRNMWQQVKRDDEGNAIEGSAYWERGSREDALALLESKQPIEAKKVTLEVEPYLIGDRKVNTYSTVIFPDENIETVFRNAGHPIVDTETGEVIASTKKAVLSKEENIKEKAEAGKTKANW